MSGNGSEEIVFGGVEDGDISGGTGSDHANELAADQLFPRAGLLHLVADREFETSTDQTRNIAFGGMIRHATHGNGLALFAVAGSEGNLQLARSDHGIFVE